MPSLQVGSSSQHQHLVSQYSSQITIHTVWLNKVIFGLVKLIYLNRLSLKCYNTLQRICMFMLNVQKYIYLMFRNICFFNVVYCS